MHGPDFVPADLVSTVLCVQDDACSLPDALPMALAAQAYAKSELLWYFRHVGDKLPPLAGTAANGRLTGHLLGHQPKAPQVAHDIHAVSLLATAAALYDLLVGAAAHVAQLSRLDQ